MVLKAFYENTFYGKWVCVTVYNIFINCLLTFILRTAVVESIVIVFPRIFHLYGRDWITKVVEFKCAEERNGLLSEPRERVDETVNAMNDVAVQDDRQWAFGCVWHAVRERASVLGYEDAECPVRPLRVARWGEGTAPGSDVRPPSSPVGRVRAAGKSQRT